MWHVIRCASPAVSRSLIAALCAAPLLVQAATPEDITPGEIARLPAYCPLTQVFTRDDPRAANVDSPARRLYMQLGPSYLALHHYCWGLVHINRAKEAGVSAYARRAMYNFALNEYKFVLKNSTPDFVLLPEIYLRVGEAYVELEAYGSALEAFTRSRELKPDYWPPYVRWAEVLRRLGKKAEALAHLEEGLRLMPTERALIDAYTRTGGNAVQLTKTLQSAPAPRPAAGAASAPAVAASAGAAPP